MWTAVKVKVFLSPSYWPKITVATKVSLEKFLKVALNLPKNGQVIFDAFGSREISRILAAFSDWKDNKIKKRVELRLCVCWRNIFASSSQRAPGRDIIPLIKTIQIRARPVPLIPSENSQVVNTAELEDFPSRKTCRDHASHSSSLFIKQFV